MARQRRGPRVPVGVTPISRASGPPKANTGVPFERPAQYGTRAFLTDAEYRKRLDDVRVRDEKDLERVDVLAGPVSGANAPIPHWREYGTTSRRTSLIVNPQTVAFPARVPGAKPWPVRQRCGTLAGGEPCDTYEDYGLGVRCIVHGEGVPDAMFPAVYNANVRVVQSPGFVAITYELIHDTRVIAIDPPADRDPLRSSVRSYMGASRGHWDGTTLVVETANLKTTPRGSTPSLKVVERFTRTAKGTMSYKATLPIPRHGRRPGRWRSTWPHARLKPACSSTPATRATTGCATCSRRRACSTPRASK